MSETQRWLSNAQMRLALQVFEDLLGHNGQTAVLHLSGLERYIDQLPPGDDQMAIPRGDMTALFSGVISMFGDQGARGVFRRWGRAFAVRRIQRHAALRLVRLGLRLWPAERRARYSLERLLHHVDMTRQEPHTSIDDDGDYFILKLSDCLYYPSQNPSQPHNLIVVGLLEGLLHWFTGDDYDVCQDVPEMVVFRVRKHPISPR